MSLQSVFPKPTLILTGHRRKKRHLIEFDGIKIWLRFSSLETLIRLIRAHEEHGYLTMSSNNDDSAEAFRLAIHRLRRDFDAVFANGFAQEQLIINGDTLEYRLDLSPDQILLVGPFADGRVPGVNSEDIESLRQLCRTDPDFKLQHSGNVSATMRK